MTSVYQRKKRRTSILLIVVSSLFVILGTGIWIAGGHPIGPICVLFFGACLVAGVMELVGTGTPKGQALAIIGCFAFAAAFVLVLVAAVAGVEITRYGSPGFFLSIVSVVGVLFFGGGGVALGVRYLRRHR